jgi:uncharacterized protein
MAILITGGTGFVGRRLQAHLKRRPEPLIICTRSPRASNETGNDSQTRYLSWNPLERPFPANDPSIQNVTIDGVINLMGEPVAGDRWTVEKKKRIRDSRVVGTRNLVDGLMKSDRIPKVLVSASAVGYYGDRGEEILTESTPPANDFLADVSQAWEAEASRLAEFGTRVVRLRIGIVLGRDGGALKEMLPIFRLGAGGKLGSGKQWFPWIHLDDLVRLIEFCLDHPAIQGPVNATAPNPVRNHEFTSVLAKELNRPAFMAVPGFALRLTLGEFASSLLASQRVIPEKALSAGFEFEYSQLAPALKAALS